MSRLEHGIGITPVLLRHAFHCLQKGIGSHPVDPPFDAFYDEVVVSELYPWSSPTGDLPSQGGFSVEFRRQGERVRWVEFACRYVGGGGPPILKEV